VTAADINPRVVKHLRGPADRAPTLRLVSGIRESDSVSFSREYRDYFAGLGQAAGTIEAAAAPDAGRLAKSMTVSASAARTLRAETLDIVTQRLDAAPFDIVIATNILPYFDDTELALAMSNIAGMLAPGGVFLHNEARPGMGDVTAAAGLRFEQARQGIIATVGGAPPLGDRIWLHRKAGK
jgi:predicted TPR repeat methyltransferase